ncbi:hypothetical protein HUT16_17620 [Kitasatospora sp. NA04385]|uniref:hypothetical protein n=1 Tax=Kitasatospora sp. NA04385 TaxID=2742135 RepID=UPI00159091E1|nr:hypothetical protein [Kitasatospora sp. NA04385]QKW20647.1 hypothetical protein HUT16_17620 [Kitasatospora sp. NA04385]
MPAYTPAELQALRAAHPHNLGPGNDGDLTLHLAAQALAEVTGDLTEGLAMFRAAGWDTVLADDHVSLMTKPIEATTAGIDLLLQGGHEIQAELLITTRRTMIRTLGPVLEQAEYLAVHADGPRRAEAVEHLQRAFEGARESLTAAAELLQRHLDRQAPDPQRASGRSAAALTVSRVLPTAPAPGPLSGPNATAAQAAADPAKRNGR